MSDAVVILGGTFDPVHVGHLTAADALRAQVGARATWLVPSAVPPHRSRPRASAADRLAMVRLAVAGRPGLVACDIEVARGGPSYTLDTVLALRQRHPEIGLWLALGADAARGLRRWDRVEQLLEQVQLLLYDRPGTPALDPRALEGLVVPGCWRRVAIATPDVSATRVRARLRRGDPCLDVVPEAVARYIAERHLYRGPAAVDPLARPPGGPGPGPLG